jgi:LuxR family maltose regulon positive regulatory protein
MPEDWFEGKQEVKSESNLILTKFAIPVLRPNRVVRRRLVDSWGQIERRAVTLVVAPAGYGKTTLMSEWAHRSIGFVAWLTLSDSDNDLVRFWQYITAALSQQIPSVTQTSLKRINLMRKPPYGTLLHPLVSEIASQPSKVTLFIDDYQEIQDPQVQASVAALLDLAPPNLHIVIGSRNQPSHTLDRVRRTNAIRELTAQDLSFTQDESREFLINSSTVALSPKVTNALLKRTDGWIVGLQIAVYGLREAENPETFAMSFSGRHRHLLDFFKEEVLSGIGEKVRKFVTRTALLERFSAELCDFVLQTTESAQILEQLGRSEMFLVPLDDVGNWFRYHRLFRDVALRDLETLYRPEIRELHLRASTWFESKGLIEEAASHAVKAEDWARVVALIEPIANHLLLSNKAGDLQSWIFGVPVEALKDAPYLSVWLARATMAGNLHTNVEVYLENPERVANLENQPELFAAVTTVRAHRLLFRGTMEPARVLIEESLRRLPPSEKFYRGIAHRLLGVEEMLSDRPIEAEAEFQLGIAYGIESKNTFTYCAAQALLAFSRGRRGLVNEALDLIQEAHRMCAEKLEVPVVQIPHVQARLLYEAWRIDDAIAALEGFEDLCEKTGYRSFSANCHSLMAQLKWASGDKAGSLVHLEQARSQTMTFGAIYEVYDREVSAVRMMLADCNWEEVNVWERSAGHGTGASNYQTRSTLERARIWKAINANDPGTAAIHLDRLRELGQNARRDGRGTDVVDAWVGQATAQFHLNQVEIALCSLTAAISLAEPTGLMRPFYEEGTRILPLLAVAKERGMESNFLSRFGGLSIPTPVASEDVALSNREVEILRLLSLGYRNHEIADSLFLSPNTIKTHLKNVFTKLSTNNRTQAVARAREMNLV